MEEIVMVRGEYMYRDRAGNITPLTNRDLPSVLLRNSERFILGEISPEQHEEVYLSCLEIEQLSRKEQKPMLDDLVNYLAGGKQYQVSVKTYHVMSDQPSHRKVSFEPHTFTEASEIADDLTRNFDRYSCQRGLVEPWDGVNIFGD